VDWCGHLMKKFDTRVVPFILPYSPFIDPGCIAYEQSEKLGYKIILKTLEDYRKALLSPSWKYALNYETKWMTRDEIADCTYTAGLKLNKLKREYGLVDEPAYKRTEERIKRAIYLTAIVDEILEMNDENAIQEQLMRLKPEFDTMLNSVMHEKVQLDWPAAKRNLRVFPLLKAMIVESLNLRG